MLLISIVTVITIQYELDLNEYSTEPVLWSVFRPTAVSHPLMLGHLRQNT